MMAAGRPVSCAPEAPRVQQQQLLHVVGLRQHAPQVALARPKFQVHCISAALHMGKGLELEEDRVPSLALLHAASCTAHHHCRTCGVALHQPQAGREGMVTCMEGVRPRAAMRWLHGIPRACSRPSRSRCPRMAPCCRACFMVKARTCRVPGSSRASAAITSAHCSGMASCTASSAAQTCGSSNSAVAASDCLFQMASHSSQAGRTHCQGACKGMLLSWPAPAHGRAPACAEAHPADRARSCTLHGGHPCCKRQDLALAAPLQLPRPHRCRRHCTLACSVPGPVNRHTLCTCQTSQSGIDAHAAWAPRELCTWSRCSSCALVQLARCFSRPPEATVLQKAAVSQMLDQRELEVRQ